MTVEKVTLEGCLLLKPSVFEDERGSFCEVYNEQQFREKTGLQTNFVQDNQSISKRGTLRGFHLQTGEYGQAKLVRVIEGEVLDVVVDLRKDSPTFKKSYSIQLSADNHLQLFVPQGFAHAFLSLSEKAIFAYKCDNYYHKASEAGIIYNDPQLAIDWHFPAEDLLLSAKDQELPTLENYLG